MHSLLFFLAVVTISSFVSSKEPTFTCKKNQYGYQPSVPYNKTVDYDPLGKKRSVGYCGDVGDPAWAQKKIKLAKNTGGVYDCTGTHSEGTSINLCCQGFHPLSDAKDCVAIPVNGQFPDSFYTCHQNDMGWPLKSDRQGPRNVPAGKIRSVGYCGAYSNIYKSWSLQYAKRIDPTDENGALEPHQYDCANSVHKLGLCCPAYGVKLSPIHNFEGDASRCIVMK